MISMEGIQSSDSIDRRVSTAGYTAANPIPTGYVACLERHQYSGNYVVHGVECSARSSHPNANTNTSISPVLVAQTSSADAEWSWNECPLTVKQDPGTSQEPDSVIVPDDVCILPIKQDEKSRLEKPNDYIELSLVACVFNFLFALVALTLSFRSRDRWRAGDRSGARGYGLASMALSVFAIVTTAIIAFVLVWNYALGAPKAYSALF